MRIEAAIARGANEPFEVANIEVDPPRPNEILVRVMAAGLCHTDLLFKGGAGGYPLPAVFGHEGAGIVESVGEAVTKVSPGDRVLITFRSCGACDRCNSGDAAYCRTWPVLNCSGCRSDGSSTLHDQHGNIASNFFGQSSFATYCVTYERNVVGAPDDIPFEYLAPLGCGVQTGVGAVLRSLDVRPDSSILIAGGGAVGLSAVMGAVIRKLATIILIEPLEARRALAMELGATHVIDPAQIANVTDAIKGIAPIGIDYALDTTGKADVLQALPGCLGSKGVLGLIGIPPPGTPVPGETVTMVTFGHTVKGIIEGDSDPDTFLPELIAFYRQGLLPVAAIVQTYPLSEINRAVDDQKSGRCVKPVLLP